MEKYGISEKEKEIINLRLKVNDRIIPQRKTGKYYLIQDILNKLKEEKLENKIKEK